MSAVSGSIARPGARAAGVGLLGRGAERVVFAPRSPGRGPMVMEKFQFAFPEQPVSTVTLMDPATPHLRREAFRDAVGSLSGSFSIRDSGSSLVTLDDLIPSVPGLHLLEYLRASGRIVPLKLA